MWIKKPEHIVKHKPPGLDEPVELGHGESAQVKQHEGEYLINNYEDYSKL